MPTTGTSIEKGATTPAGWRAISHDHTPDPATVPIRIVYAKPHNAGCASGWVMPASESPMRCGPSKISASASIGSTGTTDIHSVKCRGFGAWARALHTLPIAQPNAPASTRRNGSRAAESARCQPTRANPATATRIPATRRRVSRSRPRTTPISTVNGADAWSTSDPSPAGIPAAMPQ